MDCSSSTPSADAQPPSGTNGREVAGHAETWAHCASCDRSFYVTGATLGAMTTAPCPVCAEPPARLEQRIGDVVVPVEVLRTSAL